MTTTPRLIPIPMPNPHKPIYQRGRRNREPKTPITTILREKLMNIDKFKSRKLWVTVLGATLVSLGAELGFPEETVHSLVAIIVAYVIGQGIADHGSGTLSLVLLCGFLAFSFSPTAQAGDSRDYRLEAPTTIQLPDVPDVPEPNWFDRGSIWSFAWYDFANESNGAGVRLAYELAGQLRIRFDYLVEGFSFDEGTFSDTSEATLSLRYDFSDSANIHPYLIAGGGSASLSSFDLQYLIGAGIEYEFDNGVTVFSEFLHIRGEDGDTDDRNEVRIGAGISFETLAKIRTLWTPTTKTLPDPPLIQAQ